MEKVVQVITVVVVIALIGLISVWTQQPVLVPSLGAAMFIQAFEHKQRSASTYRILVGQLTGVAGAFVGIYLAFAWATPSFMDHHALVYARVLAVCIAVFATAILQLVFKTTSPPGAATALIVALGAETPDWAGTLRLIAGIILVTTLGEIGRRLILAASSFSKVSSKIPSNM